MNEYSVVQWIAYMQLFAEISVLMGVATLTAVIMRLLRQPLIIGHIVTGLIVGPFLLNVVHSAETLTLLSQIGIAVLLFTVGLHLSPDVIRQFGKVALLTGVGQVVFTSLAGYGVCIALGFTPITSFYVSVALAFSSTIIIMKLISDKGDFDELYAKIAIGFLLVQDVIAVLLLLGVPLLASGDTSLRTILEFLLTGFVLLVAVIVMSKFIISRASHFISQSKEFLLLFSLTWGIGVAALFRTFDFSLESGALIAGVALASFPARQEISARLTPLRDFFIVMFFILLGAQMQITDVLHSLPAAFIFSLLILVINPLILMILTGFLGFRKKTSLQAGFTVAQISEFSLILVALGVQLGHVPQSTLSLVTLVGMITIFGSTYLVMYSDRIYHVLEPYLSIFERSHPYDPRIKTKGYTVIQFGSNRFGYDLVEILKGLGKKFLVVDHDLRMVTALKKRDVEAIYGDAANIDFLDSLDLSNVELVISTIPDARTNTLIQRTMREKNPEATVVTVAHQVIDALAHYEEGIDYVILPHMLGGRHAAELFMKFKYDKSKYHELRREQIEYLQQRLAAGQ